MKTFSEAIHTREFVLTAELLLTPDSDATSIIDQARVLGPHVDAILVTENQYGAVHMSPLAAASILIQEGVDAILQLSACNRNRAALIGDLLGARAAGITSLQLVQGKKMPDSYQPQPMQVKDLGVDELIATANVINEDALLTGAAEFLIGGAAKAHSPKPDWTAPRLVGKVDAGVKFIHTQLCFDLKVLRSFAAELVAIKLVRRCDVIADIAALPSADSARWLRENLSHIMIPGKIIQRLKAAADPEQEGVQICSEYLQEIAIIPGISGVNFIANGNPAMTVDAIKVSGLRGG
jgi:methylenetetrahydrofolate reductase (NADPH)